MAHHLISAQEAAALRAAFGPTAAAEGEGADPGNAGAATGSTGADTPRREPRALKWFPLVVVKLGAELRAGYWRVSELPIRSPNPISDPGGVYRARWARFKKEDDSGYEMQLVVDHYPALPPVASLQAFTAVSLSRPQSPDSLTEGREHKLTINNPGCYLVYGERKAGKTAFMKHVTLFSGPTAAYLRVTEDGSSLPGTASTFSAIANAIARKQGVYVIDSLMAAGVYGDALAAGGVAKSLFVGIANTLNTAAKVSGSIVYAIVNPLGVVKDEAKEALEIMAEATTAGAFLLSRKAFTFENAMQDYEEGLDPEGITVDLFYSLRPERKDIKDSSAFIPRSSYAMDDLDFPYAIVYGIDTTPEL
jgi:hypothetical protein